MNDPHVEVLHYRFESLNATDNFDNANPQTGIIDTWEYQLSDGILKVSPQIHYSSEDDARVALEPLLRNWEESSFLSKSKHYIKFIFDHSDIIDRRPSPGNQTLHVHSAGSFLLFGKVTVVRNNSNYPPPEINYQSSPLTEFFISRLLRYRQGSELLTTMAYTILSRLVGENKGPSEKAKRFAVSKNLLGRIGELSSIPDPEYGRKGKGKGKKTISKIERMWLEEAIRLLILRVGEVEAGGQGLPILSVNDVQP